MLSHLEIHELACSWWSFLWRWRAIFSRPACCFSWLFRWVTPSIHVDPWAVDAGTSYPNNNFSTLACVSVFDVPNGWTWWCPMWVSRWSRIFGKGRMHSGSSTAAWVKGNDETVPPSPVGKWKQRWRHYTARAGVGRPQESDIDYYREFSYK